MLLEQAEYTKIQIAGLSGGVNTVGIVGTIISAQIIDRLGRRACLMGGSVVLFAVNLIVRLIPEKLMTFAILIIYRLARYMKHRTTTQKMSRHMHLQRSQCFSYSILGTSEISELFFSWELIDNSYAATWGTVAFLIPTEIFPSDLRAQGNGFGITGWAIGVGMTTLVNPIMFGHLYVSCIGSFIPG